jgi:hypothetical protein
MRWLSGNTIEIVQGNQAWRFEDIGDHWTLKNNPGASVVKANQKAGHRLAITLREGLNEPPHLVATDLHTGVSRTILDIEPRIRQFKLGRVEMLDWKDSTGMAWRGRFYHPVGTIAGPVPLVIQTHGYAPDTEFSLLGDGDAYITTSMAAQALAARGIAVLQIQDPPGTETPAEPAAFMRGCSSIIAELARRGWIDTNKVGLVGFSRSGWYVEYTLTHSSFNYAAASIADNIDSSYVQATFYNYLALDFELQNGGSLFGDGLMHWLKEAPGFNVDKVHTPVRLERDAGGIVGAVLGQWEVYVRLHDLGKPVELFLIPDSTYASHPVQIPAQQLSSEGNMVDWMDFWLNGHEDTGPGKAAQYRRWEKLCDLQTTQKLNQPTFCVHSSRTQ